jgi:hypothetical protein
VAHPWTSADEAELKDDIAESGGRDEWVALARAVSDARAWLAAHPGAGGRYAMRLRPAVAFLAKIEPEDDEPLWHRRTALVLEYDQPQRGWWGARQPTVRELALLSLLAGEWPEWATRRLKAQSVTVLEVVAAEERAIREAIKRNHTRE